MSGRDGTHKSPRPKVYKNAPCGAAIEGPPADMRQLIATHAATCGACKRLASARDAETDGVRGREEE